MVPKGPRPKCHKMFIAVQDEDENEDDAKEKRKRGRKRSSTINQKPLSKAEPRNHTSDTHANTVDDMSLHFPIDTSANTHNKSQSFEHNSSIEKFVFDSGETAFLVPDTPNTDWLNECCNLNASVIDSINIKALLEEWEFGEDDFIIGSSKLKKSVNESMTENKFDFFSNGFNSFFDDKLNATDSSQHHNDSLAGMLCMDSRLDLKIALKYYPKKRK
jgi:hypothetical protein